MKRIALASLLVAGLLACRADQMSPPRPSGLIRDAGHNGGNFFFAFLQPMVSRPTLNGTFDATQSPIVKVGLLSGGASCVEPNLTYTMSTGPGSETIRVSATDRHYIVNLHTDRVPVASGCTYRIRVLIGSVELGFADIALFLNQKEAKNLTDDQTVSLVDGRTLPIKFWIAEGVLRDFGEGTASPAQQTIIVTQNMRAGVLVPAGAVLQPTTITIESLDDRPCFPGILGRTLQGTRGATENSCYRFTADPPLPDGKFEKNVIVAICVDLSLLSEDEEQKLQILQFDNGDTPKIQALENASAPFLPCDPSYQTPIGLGEPGLLDRAARWMAALVNPKPLFARANNMVFDVGAGGSSEGFSLFTWGFVTNMEINAGDEQSALTGDAVETPPSVKFTDSTGAPVDSVPVTFSVGLGGGSITGAATKSGRGGIPGVAQVGSWTLGSVGTNTLVASAPPSSTVTPTLVTFNATGIAPSIFSATFTSDALDTEPLTPDIGRWELVAPVDGSILVRSAVADLTNKPVEIANIGGEAGTPGLHGIVAGTPPTSGLWVVRWRSVMSAASESGWSTTITVYDGALPTSLIATIAYLPGGQLNYGNSFSTANRVGTWTLGESQLFELTIDLDANVVKKLTIDGDSVTGGRPFEQEAAASLGRIRIGGGGTSPNTLGWDDIEIAPAAGGILIGSAHRSDQHPSSVLTVNTGGAGGSVWPHRLSMTGVGR